MSKPFDPFASGLATEEKPFDPFAAGLAVEDKPFDPFASGLATEDKPASNWLEDAVDWAADKTKRLGRSLAQVPGQALETLGTTADVLGRAMNAAGTLDPAMNPGAWSDPATPENVRLALTTETPGTARLKAEGRHLREGAADLYNDSPTFRPDPRRDDELLSQAADSTGSLAAAMAVPGGLVTKTLTGALLNSQAQADEARRIQQARGAADPETTALTQFVANLPAGAIEALPWGMALRRFGGTNLAHAIAEKYGKNALARITTAVFGQAAAEAGEEGLQQLWGNASAILDYDPERQVTQGVGSAIAVGGILGGGLGGALQTTAELANRAAPGPQSSQPPASPPPPPPPSPPAGQGSAPSETDLLLGAYPPAEVAAPTGQDLASQDMASQDSAPVPTLAAPPSIDAPPATPALETIQDPNLIPAPAELAPAGQGSAAPFATRPDDPGEIEAKRQLWQAAEQRYVRFDGPDIDARALHQEAARLREEYHRSLVPKYDDILFTLPEAHRLKGGDLREHVIFRGEAEPPSLIRVEYAPGGDISNISESWYPMVDAILSNGSKMRVQVRVSNHPQVSANAPRRYGIDFSFPAKAENNKGAWTKKFQAVLKEEISQSGVIDEVWKEQRAVLGNETAAGDEASGGGIKPKTEASAEADKSRVPVKAEPEVRSQNDQSTPAADGNPKSAAQGTLFAKRAPAEFAIRAYHGTPHKVSRFSTEKVGTGEGAAAYGWGLYFAQNDDVAEQYRRKLTQRKTLTPEMLRDYYQPGRVVPSYGGHDRVVEFRGDPYGEWSVVVERVENSGGDWVPAGERPRAHSTMPTFAQAKQVGLDVSNVYTVELAPEPEQLLDWDKPLEAQTPPVLAILKSKFPHLFAEQWMHGTDILSSQTTIDLIQADPARARSNGVYRGVPAKELRGSDLYHAFAREGRAEYYNRRAASLKLADVGIPGIKYLDEGSRGAGLGEAATTSNFVIFDDKHVKILAENGIPVQTAAEFAQRGDNEARAATRAQLSTLQTRWRDNAHRIAPGLMESFRLRFGSVADVVALGRADPRTLTGHEEAAYLGYERLFFLFDHALTNRSDLATRLNLLHEMAHAHLDTLEPRRQADLIQNWLRETGQVEGIAPHGPLYHNGRLRRGVALGVKEDFKEWYAERLAWAHHRYAARRETLGAPAPGETLFDSLARDFRDLLRRLLEFLERLHATKIDLDFRAFLDQGTRFAPTMAPAPAMAATRAPAGPDAAYARRNTLATPAPDRFRHLLRRYFTSAGDLPLRAYETLRARDHRLAAIEKHAAFSLRDLDRALTTVYGGARAMTPAQHAAINAVLAGAPNLHTLDPRLRAPLTALRADLDTLSARLISEGIVPGATAARIEGNLGLYLHRSYRKFDDPQWAAKVPEPILNRARSFIAAELAARQTTPGPISPAEIDGYVRHILAKDTPTEAFFTPATGTRLDLSILTRRKEIPQELRDLMGEYHDPRVNYLRSIAKTARLLETNRLLHDLRRTGLGHWLHDRPLATPAGNYTTLLAPQDSATMAPLAGLYTTPEIAAALTQALTSPSEIPILRWWLRANGLAKASKTVLSHVTQIRNVLANLLTLVAGAHWRLDAATQVWRAIKTDLGRGDTPANRAYLLRLHRLGILGESVSAGELREALRLAHASLDLDTFTDTILARAAKAPLRLAERLYRTGDDIFKIYAFENERRAWAHAEPTLTPEQLDAIAAERIANTLPNYSRLPAAAQFIRRWGLTGSFVAFPSEILRNGYHLLNYTAQDLRSPNPRIRAMGAGRLAGLILAATIPAAATAATLWLTNLDRERERDLRRFLPEWNRHANLAHLSHDGAGRYRLADASYLDPFSYLKRPLTAFLNGKDWQTSLRDSALETLAPWLDEGILAKHLLDLSRNTDATGLPIANPTAPWLDRAQAQLAHLWRAFEPGSVTQLSRHLRAARGEVTPSGRAYNQPDEILASLTGARAQSIDVAAALIGKTKRFYGQRHDAELLYTQVRDTQGAAPEALAQAREKMETVRRRLHTELHLDARAAQRLGVAPGHVVLALIAGGLSERDAALILADAYLPHLTRAPSRARILGEAVKTRP